MSSRGSGGSRYPSAYGHTPSYRSYNAMPSSSGLVGHGYPSALGSSSLGSSALGDRTADRILADTDKYFTDSSLSSRSAFDKYDLGMPSTTGSSSSNSAKKVQSSSYTSSYSSASDGGRPVVESSSDYTMRSANTGASGIPHTSYAHQSSNYSSDSPYKNRVSSYSYNI